MSEKSKGDTSKVVKNPLLSASVTGLTFDDFPHKPLLLPAAPPVVAAPVIESAAEEPQKSVTVGQTPDIDTETLSEINLNAPTDEYTNQLEISGNLQDNIQRPDDSILSQAASSFSQLPTVASTVFSTFSKVIKDYTPSTNTRENSAEKEIQQITTPSFQVNDPFPTPSQIPESNYLAQPNQPPPEPPKFYSPLDLPRATSGPSTTTAQNTYRLTAKKKTYAQIPGLSSHNFSDSSHLFNPQGHPNQNFFTPSAPPQALVTPAIENISTQQENPQKPEESRGLFSLSSFVPPVWQNISGFVQGSTKDHSETSSVAESPQLIAQSIDSKSNFEGNYYKIETSNVGQFPAPPPPISTGNFGELHNFSANTENITKPTQIGFVHKPEGEHILTRKTSESGFTLDPNSTTSFPNPIETNIQEKSQSQTPAPPLVGFFSPTNQPTNFPITATTLNNQKQQQPTEAATFFNPSNFGTNPQQPSSGTTSEVNTQLDNKLPAHGPPKPPPTGTSSSNTFRLQKGTRHYRSALNPASSNLVGALPPVISPAAVPSETGFPPPPSSFLDVNTSEYTQQSQPNLFNPAPSVNYFQPAQQNQPIVPQNLSFFNPLNPVSTTQTGFSTNTQQSFKENLQPVLQEAIKTEVQKPQDHGLPTTQYESVQLLAPADQPLPDNEKKIDQIPSEGFDSADLRPPSPLSIQLNQFSEEIEKKLTIDKQQISAVDSVTSIISEDKKPQHISKDFAAVSSLKSVNFEPTIDKKQPAREIQPNYPSVPTTTPTVSSQPAPSGHQAQQAHSIYSAPTSSFDNKQSAKSAEPIPSTQPHQSANSAYLAQESQPILPSQSAQPAAFFVTPSYVENPYQQGPIIQQTEINPIQSESSVNNLFSVHSSFNNATIPTSANNSNQIINNVQQSTSSTEFNLTNYFGGNQFNINPQAAPPPQQQQQTISTSPKADVNLNPSVETSLISEESGLYPHDLIADKTPTTSFFQSDKLTSKQSNLNKTKPPTFKHIQDPLSFFDSFHPPTSGDVQNNNLTISEDPTNIRIQDFFNNPPQALNDSGSDLNYKLVGSGVVDKRLENLSAPGSDSRALSPTSNIVEPPSSSCSEFSSEFTTQFVGNLSKLTENDLPDELLEEYNKMSGFLASSSGHTNVVYRPATRHWFYKNVLDNKQVWTPFSYIDSALLEEHFIEDDRDSIVPVQGGRYDVNITDRTRTPVYWSGEPTEVRRCSWFYKAIDSKYVPYEESVADLLEEEYRDASVSGEWHRKIALPTGETVVFHGPTVMVHFLQLPASPDSAWSGTTATTARPRVVKRDIDDFAIEQGEPRKVDHLIFMVHGIGSACDLKFRNLEEVVEEFRSIALQLVQSHYKNSCDKNLVGRIEVLPVSWHSQLHSEELGIDEKLKAITLESIPKLRNFANDTLLDVLFYTSPIFCQSIMSTVSDAMNRVYSKYCQRNPNFNGGVSLAGHSLGSLILFDLLCHQKPLEETLNSENPDQFVQPLMFRQGMPESNATVSQQVSYTVGPAGTGQPFLNYPQLIFQPKHFFALGSPIGMFVTIRGIDALGLDFKLPTCSGFYNIFHPYDPVAYRIEALVNPEFSNVRPVLIPHHKGRKRMHLELKETMTRVGADLKNRICDTLKNTMNSVYFLSSKTKPDPSEIEKEVDKVLDMQLKLDQEPRSRSGSTSTHSDYDTATEIDLPLGKLNNSRRIDYVLQEAPLEFFNEYLFALTSHVCYWESEDTILFIIKEIYSSLHISTDSQIPQQSMTIERPNSANSFSLSPTS